MLRKRQRVITKGLNGTLSLYCIRHVASVNGSKKGASSPKLSRQRGEEVESDEAESRVCSEGKQALLMVDMNLHASLPSMKCPGLWGKSLKGIEGFFKRRGKKKGRVP